MLLDYSSIVIEALLLFILDKVFYVCFCFGCSQGNARIEPHLYRRVSFVLWNICQIFQSNTVTDSRENSDYTSSLRLWLCPHWDCRKCVLVVWIPEGISSKERARPSCNHSNFDELQTSNRWLAGDLQSLLLLRYACFWSTSNTSELSASF